MKKKQSPARKKQKKTSKVAEDKRQVSVETLSGEEESEAEGRGSSSDKTDIVVDSPPVNPTDTPIDQPSKPNSPPPASQPTITPTEQEQDQPSQLAEEEAPEENQSQQQAVKEVSAMNVVASEGTTAEVESQKAKSPTMRVKHVMTYNPFGRRKRGEASAALGAETKKEKEELNVQQGEEEMLEREKLPIRRKQGAQKGKPATATSGAFKAPAQEDEQSLQHDEAAVSRDAAASKEPEVENAQIQPAVTQREDPAAVAKEQIPPVPVLSPEASVDAVASTDTAMTGAGEQEKKKEGKKKKIAESSKMPVRQSGRLRSGALNK